MSQRLVMLVVICLLLPTSMRAQQGAPILGAEEVFQTWQPAAFPGPTLLHALPVPPREERSRDRLGNALLGGAIGAGAGLVFCTIVSNLVNEGTGFSTCTAKGYLLTGGVGFGLGFLIGLSV